MTTSNDDDDDTTPAPGLDEPVVQSLARVMADPGRTAWQRDRIRMAVLAVLELLDEEEEDDA